MKPIRFQDLIISEDQDFVLINKPPFVATLEDRNDPQNILALAKEYSADAQVCHRLDKDTSGVLAIAKNPGAYRHLNMQFEDRRVKKIYHAVVDGIHYFKKELIDAPILKQNDGTVKISREGKKAQTYFSTLQNFKSHTLVECNPITGRMHQIRIHLTRLNAPITGDETYGGKPFFCLFCQAEVQVGEIHGRAAIDKKNGIARLFTGIYGFERSVGGDYGTLS